MQQFQRYNKNIVNEDSVVCKICNKEWDHLGSHLKVHNITTREYKKKFGLPYRLSLTSQKVIDKKRKAQKKWLKLHKVDFAKAGKKHRFKKGHTNNGRHRSKKEIEQAIENIKKENTKRQKLRNCPVCNMQFRHLESHLYNKHGLLKAPK